MIGSPHHIFWECRQASYPHWSLGLAALWVIQNRSGRLWPWTFPGVDRGPRRPQVRALNWASVPNLMDRKGDPRRPDG